MPDDFFTVAEIADHLSAALHHFYRHDRLKVSAEMFSIPARESVEVLAPEYLRRREVIDRG
jgi:hypothetical protein